MIISIHQPRYDIFSTFDDVILLSKGELVWAGPTDAMLEHFQALGHPCPSHSNPADFILDLSSINVRFQFLLVVLTTYLISNQIIRVGFL